MTRVVSKFARGSVVSAIALGVVVTIVAPQAAQAAPVPAPVVSQGEGRLATAALLGASIDALASLAGAQAVNYDATGDVIVNQPLNATALSALNVQSGGVDLFGTNGLIKLGAVGQYGRANDDGSSVAFSGTVSSASSLVGAGTVVTPGDIGTTGAGNSAEIGLGSPTAPVQLGVTIGALAASATQPAGNAAPTGQYDIANLNIVVGGTTLGGTISGLNTLVAPVIATVNGLVGAGSQIANPLASGNITVSLSDLLAAAGVATINDLAPGTNLLTYLPAAVVTKLNTSVTGLLASLGTAISALGPLGIVAGIALAGIQGPVAGILGGLGTALTGPLGTAVNALAQLNVNNKTTNADGSFTETALIVGLGTNGALARVGLANATVGPNAGLAGVPIVNPESLMLSGGIAVVILGSLLLAAMIRRRRTTGQLAIDVR